MPSFSPPNWMFPIPAQSTANWKCLALS